MASSGTSSENVPVLVPAEARSFYDAPSARVGLHGGPLQRLRSTTDTRMASFASSTERRCYCEGCATGFETGAYGFSDFVVPRLPARALQPGQSKLRAKDECEPSHFVNMVYSPILEM